MVSLLLHQFGLCPDRMRLCMARLESDGPRSKGPVPPTSSELYNRQLDQMRLRSLAKALLVLYCLLLTFLPSVCRSIGW